MLWLDSTISTISREKKEKGTAADVRACRVLSVRKWLEGP